MKTLLLSAALLALATAAGAEELYSDQLQRVASAICDPGEYAERLELFKCINRANKEVMKWDDDPGNPNIKEINHLLDRVKRLHIQCGLPCVGM